MMDGSACWNGSKRTAWLNYICNPFASLGHRQFPCDVVMSREIGGDIARCVDEHALIFVRKFL